MGHHSCRCALLEQQCQQLKQQLSDATSQLERVRQQQGQLQRKCDKRLAAVKASAAAEREALSARHAAKVKKLQEAAKDQVCSDACYVVLYYSLWQCSNMQVLLLCPHCPYNRERLIRGECSVCACMGTAVCMVVLGERTIMVRS
jgi:hypothetical protein